MAAEEIHIGDIGTIFELTVKDGEEIVDISAATNLSVLFKKPSGEVVTKVAVLKNTGIDGIMQYITIAGDLDETGGWRLQGRVVLPTGTWSSDIHPFKVYGNLD